MSAERKPNFKIICGIGLVVGALAGVLVSRYMMQPPQLRSSGRSSGSNSSSSSVERELREFAIMTNKKLPVQIDAHTRLDRIDPGPGKTYSYIYTINRNLTNAEKQSIRKTVSRNVLSQPTMQPIFAAGFTVWYKYYNASGKSMLEFPVKK